MKRILRWVGWIFYALVVVTFALQTMGVVVVALDGDDLSRINWGTYGVYAGIIVLVNAVWLWRRRRSTLRVAPDLT